MSRRPPLVERLEPRQLLAADLACGPAELTAFTTPGVAAPLRAAAPDPAAVARQFLGTFRGGGSGGGPFNLEFFDMEVTVASLTAGGFTGSVTTDTGLFGGGNRRQVAGTFTGRLKPRGAFRYVLRQPGLRVSFKGRLIVQNDRLVGYVRMKVGPGQQMPRGDVHGEFGLDRVGAPAPPGDAV